MKKMILSVLAGLVTGLTLLGVAKANEFSITLNPVQSLSDVLVVVGWASGNVLTVSSPDEPSKHFIIPEYVYYQRYLGNVPSGNSTYNFSLGETATFYTVFEIYNNQSNGVTVAMKDVPTGKLWNEYFNRIGIQTPLTESQVAGYLRGYASGPLTYEVENYVCALNSTYPSIIGGPIPNVDIIGATGTASMTVVEPLHLVNFSGATVGGSVSMVQTSTSPVPEPATMLLFGTGIAGLAAVGRRKRS